MTCGQQARGRGESECERSSDLVHVGADRIHLHSIILHIGSLRERSLEFDLGVRAHSCAHQWMHVLSVVDVLSNHEHHREEGECKGRSGKWVGPLVAVFGRVSMIPPCAMSQRYDRSKLEAHGRLEALGTELTRHVLGVDGKTSGGADPQRESSRARAAEG